MCEKNSTFGYVCVCVCIRVRVDIYACRVFCSYQEKYSRVAGKNQSFLPGECVLAFSLFYFAIFFLFFLFLFSSRENEYSNVRRDVACPCLNVVESIMYVCVCVLRVCCATRVYVCVRARGCKYNN